MEDVNHHIAIISDQALRAESLSKTIEKEFNQPVEIPIFHTEQIEAVIRLSKPLLLLVDLMGLNKSYKEIILPILDLGSDIKIIALHFYRLSTLVNPLYKAGIQGYVYYEPSREELLHAIKMVASGGK